MACWPGQGGTVKMRAQVEMTRGATARGDEHGCGARGPVRRGNRWNGPTTRRLGITAL
jgi:hypothetical protein